MLAAIKQIVTVRSGGVIEVHSPELHEGDRAEVTVVVLTVEGERRPPGIDGWRRYAGAANSGDRRAGDNQRIDSDLAAEYGSRSKAGS
jgi:hypothetical protein